MYELYRQLAPALDLGKVTLTRQGAGGKQVQEPATIIQLTDTEKVIEDQNRQLRGRRTTS